MTHRANYALVTVLEQLGPSADALDVPWAEYAGDETAVHGFTVPEGATEAYVELQAYDIGAYTHEIVLNGDPLSGFDVPPAEGWQYWMDAITERELAAGENTLQIRRDTATDDAFAVGTAVVNWKEPVE
ncbi:MAG: hypothetical protein V5A44_05125 [Haloarculaceae archaeon]